ncbi:hypothetical protein SAMD00019534_069920 [Acytostelium subglobosum LB1]|uniref:hypothetical protein n=1 Tax=Acytostelium subglobosum LB1 TaxID=1410327 RepID=UPI000644E61C|nr:hypothetical protein SAMD00019534_069920 [Acytostelium subglobosum LB1]GAM23817.1 hypothetical protein SAMD00019534_069920 [Acytostelium subglobosum LB1]|eukprot:XP_012753558.1 hypothetical protein SAMD00019534_069920 [Acytostelium subglobosum LB1]
MSSNNNNNNNDNNNKEYLQLEWSSFPDQLTLDAAFELLKSKFKIFKEESKINFLEKSKKYLTFEFGRLEKIVSIIVQSVYTVKAREAGIPDRLGDIIGNTTKFVDEYHHFITLYDYEIKDIIVLEYANQLETIQTTMCDLSKLINDQVNEVVKLVDKVVQEMEVEVRSLRGSILIGAVSTIGNLASYFGSFNWKPYLGHDQGRSLALIGPVVSMMVTLVKGIVNIADRGIDFYKMTMAIRNLKACVPEINKYKDYINLFMRGIGLREQFMRALGKATQQHSCVICLGTLVNPHFSNDGESLTYYCYDCIAKWIQLSKTNPKTREPMEMDHLFQCNQQQVDTINRCEVIRKQFKVCHIWS